MKDKHITVLGDLKCKSKISVRRQATPECQVLRKGNCLDDVLDPEFDIKLTVVDKSLDSCIFRYVTT